MELRTQPRPPQPVLFIRLAAPKIPHGWRQYLPDSKARPPAALDREPARFPTRSTSRGRAPVAAGERQDDAP